MDQTYWDTVDAIDWAAFRTTALVDSGPSGSVLDSLRHVMAARDAQTAREAANTALEVARTSCPKLSRIPKAWSGDGGLVRLASTR
jgi:hypothetical protein